MKPKVKNIWLSTGLALGILVVLAFVYQNSQKSGVQKTGEKGYQLIPAGKEWTNLILTLSLNGENVRTAFSLDGDWLITSPFQDAADPDHMDAAMTALNGLTAEERYSVTNQEIYKQYGLTRPFMTIEAVDSLGEKSALILGGKNPTGDYRYVLKAGDESVYLMYDYKIENLKKTPGEWRSRQLFTISMDKLNSAAWKTPAEDYRLTKTGTDTFLVKPAGVKLDSLSVRSFFMDFYAIPAVRFLDLKPGEIPVKNSPAVIVTLSGEGRSETVKLYGLADNGQLIGEVKHRGGGWFYLSAEAATNLLSMKMSSLWEK